jgi:hypothetical protein
MIFAPLGTLKATDKRYALTLSAKLVSSLYPISSLHSVPSLSPSIASLHFSHPLPSRCLALYPPPLTPSPPDSDRLAEYDVKLTYIDVETITIHETEYNTRNTLSRVQLRRSQPLESIRIKVCNARVRFASDSQVGSGSALLRQSRRVRESIMEVIEAVEMEGDDMMKRIWDR